MPTYGVWCNDSLKTRGSERHICWVRINDLHAECDSLGQLRKVHVVLDLQSRLQEAYL